jgi:heme exporter protein D
MNFNAFIASAYLVFFAVLVWDYVAPRIRLGNIRRAIALRARREKAKKSPVNSAP